MGIIRLLVHHKSVILLAFFLYISLWLTIQTLKQSTEQNSNQLRPSPNSSFYFILNHLFQSNFKIILIDPFVLDFLFIYQLPFDKLDKQLVTFAIVDESVQLLLQTLQRTSVFSVQTSTTTQDNHRISIDHIFITYQHKILHLAVLHKYHSFYLVQPNHHRFSDDDNVHLPFGDKLRAVDHIESESYEYLFYYPRNVPHFLWLYETSEFLHCNRQLADQMENDLHIYQNTSQLNITVVPMKNIAFALDKLQKRYWLAGGTLLGWYRHCGLIPYTLDADFGLYAEEYDETVRSHFLGNPITYLWGALGLVNDSLEFRLYTGRFTLDLFWAYRDGDHRWCGYQTNRVKFRRTLPLLEKLCSCDLFGHRFSVPCSPVQYLDSEYGKDKWKTPLEKNYTWTNMKYHSIWDDISWMYAVRLYTRQGKLRTDNFAIEWISKHFNYSLTSIPSFLNVLPNHPVTLPPLKATLVYGTPMKRKSSRKKAAKNDEKKDVI
ncbi:unnamed protein product [Adineta ricciae]|uniref:LicD/FKTN/FKRP nucleotidyltransferase domain-containing protein n=2 Tax=Adineta ricciae TaxID=249248 RepID=A0A814ZNN9_ADIRI|nr:unnamed protein product [Adineta ricciae]